MTLFAATTSATWLLTRASGAVSLLLLTATFALGIADVARWKSRTWPRFAVDALHRNLALLAVAFVGVHVFTTLVDTFVSIGVVAAFVPFSNGYKTFFLGLGALAFDLLLALIVTSVLRRRIGVRMWRAVHWAAYACWPVALVHALGTGTDAAQTWMLALAAGCTAVVGGAIVARLSHGGFGGDLGSGRPTAGSRPGALTR